MGHPDWGIEWEKAAVNVPDAPSSRQLRRESQQRRKKIIKYSLFGLLSLVVVFVALGVWVGLDALRAKAALEASATKISDIRELAEGGDTQELQLAITDVQKQAGKAHSATTGFHWSLYGSLPIVGDNIKAFATVSETVDDLAQNALPDLADAVELADPANLAPEDGRIDLAPIKEAAPGVIKADASVLSALDKVNAIDQEALFSFVKSPISDYQEQLADVAGVTRTASKAVQLLPNMLGDSGPRQYLLLVQNNAEQRATGGIPGSLIQLQADAGKVEIIDQVAANQLKFTGEPVVELSEAEKALFGDDLAELMVDATFTPDFPRVAEISSLMWQRLKGVEVDGVLAIDPVLLAKVLEGTGPVETSAGVTLTSDNAAEFLLNTVYIEVSDPKQQDAIFNAVAKDVFSAVTAGVGDAAKVVNGLADAAGEDRMLVWSKHTEEQDLLDDTVLSGRLVGVDGDSPVVGVYLNDGSAAKIGYYLEPEYTVRDIECRPDGSQKFVLDVSVTSLAPENASTLPPYLTGGGKAVEPGLIKTNILVYAPQDGGILESSASVGDAGLFSQVHNDLVVGGRTVTLAPGEKQTFSYSLISGKDQRGEIKLRVTPGPRSEKISVSTSSCD